ncbi:MAG: dephospho-CoA kinase [Planctomycetaceae bacterium]
MTAQKTIPVIGIVGGIGSGKSAIANGLAKSHPITVIDADLIGHRVLEQRPVKHKLRDQFGTDIFDGEDHIIRSKLADIVFGPTAEHTAARDVLQGVVHPVIQQTIEQRIADIRHQAQHQAVLLDAAILLETGWRSACDHVVFVDVPQDLRQLRVSENRNWDARKWSHRESMQWPLDKKRDLADFILDNSGHLNEAVAGLAKIVDRVCST